MSDRPTVAEVQTLIDYVKTLEDRAKQDADALRVVTMERATLRTEVARLTARVAELEAPGECASIHKLQAKLSEVVAERDRYKTGCEHYLERAETVRHLMTVGEDVVGTLHRIAGEYVQVSFSRWRWRRMVTDGVPDDTERVLRREWLVSEDRAILVAAFGADVVAKVEAS